MKYLLDTNVCINLLQGSDPALLDRIQSIPRNECSLCSVVRAELQYGARNSRRVEQNLAAVEALFDWYDSFPFDDRVADHYGAIRTQLKRDGTPIGQQDMMIAATAMTHDLTLVTRDQQDFSRVAGLRWVRW